MSVPEILREFGGDPQTLFDKACLSRRAPPNREPYRQFFRAPIRFDSEQNAVVFRTHWLDHRLSSADPLLQHHLMSEANERHARRREDTVARLRR
jgi:hypothetical protein